MSTDPVSLLVRAVDQTATVIAAIKPDQADLPTPCRSWPVRQVIEHLMNDIDQFEVTATGGTADWSKSTRPVGDDWYGEFRAGADRLVAAWRRAGDLSGTIALPGMGDVPARFPLDMQVAELAVHAWDLARATGQPTDLDQEIGQHALGFMTSSMRPEFRGDEAEGKMFAPAVPVPDDAPVYDRLAGFAGRAPR